MIRRTRPEPERRYEVYRRGGHSPEAALSLVLSSYGLSQNLVETSSDGTQRAINAKWTLEEVCRLSFLLDSYNRGRIGGPEG